MATRSTITIESDRAKVQLYRHWDGYPEATGRHLAWALRSTASLTIEELTVRLLSSCEGEPHASGKYEITCGSHGDTQWHYAIRLRHREEPEIAVFHRPIGEKFQHVGTYCLGEYRSWILNRFRPFLARIRAMRRAA